MGATDQPGKAVAPGPGDFGELSIAAIVPCHNEAAAIGKVVDDLRRAVPTMTVYVYDNCSVDKTAEVAARHGAVVREERVKGKGNVVRRAFSDIEADVYLMIDGDDTYDAAAAPRLIQLLLDGPYDHVLGVREPIADALSPYRAGHERGNRMINALTGWVFGSAQEDMLSGYRVMSRRFVKSFPAVSREFEIETELTVHTLALRLPHVSARVGFKDRADGSESKLRTYRDGIKIMGLVANLARHERPYSVYGLIGVVLGVLGALSLVPVAIEFVDTGLVPRLPTLVTALVLIVLSCFSGFSGLIIDGQRKARHEASRLMYLRYPAVSCRQRLRHGEEVTTGGDTSSAGRPVRGLRSRTSAGAARPL